MKHLDELVSTNEPAWDVVREWLADAKNHCEILPNEVSRAEMELVNAQVTTRSPMGAVIYETGGILIDHGWIRVLGSGSPRLDRGLMEWNKGKSFDNYGDVPGFLLVADDVIGGYFAINAGAIGSEPGNVCYLAPDTLEWEDMGFGYSHFLNWLFDGNIRGFYESFKWQGWQEDVKTINGNQVFQFYPFLWTKYDHLEDLDRKAISAEENYALTMEMQKQLSCE